MDMRNDWRMKYNLYMTEYEVRTYEHQTTWIYSVLRPTQNHLFSLSLRLHVTLNWADIGISDFLGLLSIQHGGDFSYINEDEPRRVFWGILRLA